MPFQYPLRTIAAICLLLAFHAASASGEPLKTSPEFDSLPLPIKTYVMQLGTEQGLKEPADINIDGNPDFLFPVKNGDVNSDGKPDYHANACQFSPAEAESAYHTNGFTCAFGMLAISTPYGGYSLLLTSGLLNKVTVKSKITLYVLERNFDMCGSSTYMCLTQYRLKDDGYGNPSLTKITSKPVKD